jgi:hypothetical protein
MLRSEQILSFDFLLLDFVRCIIVNANLAAIIMLEAVFANGWFQMAIL